MTHTLRYDFHTGTGQAFNARRHTTIVCERLDGLESFERRLREYGLVRTGQWVTNEHCATASAQSQT